MKLSIAILLTGLLVLFPFEDNLFAQQKKITVTGSISTSENSEKLPYASILEKGKGNAVRSDTSGNFQIIISSPDAILVISYIGYKTTEVKVNGRTKIDVALDRESSSMNEVVIVGYGSVAKKDLTGSVASVNLSDLSKAPVASFQQALAGRVAGVQVSSIDGQPGEGLNIVIRGNNSLTGSNAPLYVIDGFPMEDFNSNSLNIAEIESIDILKDASATAIYGARGANGVVMITTKKGKTGDARVTYSGSAGYSNVSRANLDVLGPYDFIKLQQEIDPQRAAALYFKDSDPATPDLTIEDFRDVKGIDWFDRIVGTGSFQNHSAGVSGGTPKTKYALSLSYLNQDGVVMRSGFDRLQGRFNIDQLVGRKFKVGLNVNFADSKVRGIKPREQTSKAVGSGNSNVQNLFYNLWTYRPISGRETDLEDEGVDPAAETFLFNPLKSAQNEYDVDKIRNITINGYLEYDLTQSLKLRFTGSADLSATRSELFNNSNTRSGSPLTGVGRTNGVNGGLWQEEVSNLSNENSLTYTKKFNKNHQLTAVGVFSVQSRKENRFGYKANLVPNEALGINGLDEGVIFDKESSSTTWGLVSYTGRVNYNLFQKYLFTATFRADGSSKFPADSKWGYFPSGAVAWRLSDEPFMKNISFISNAKLRTSFGVTGNNRVSDFGYLSNIILGTYYPFGPSSSPAYYQGRLGNEKLKWESTRQFDAGIELGFLKNRLELEMDYYHKHTYDLLLNSQIASSTGYGSATVNIGKTQNRGFELTLNSKNITTKNFNWNSNINISFNQNKLVALSAGEDLRMTSIPDFSTNFPSPAWISRVGNQMVHYYGFVYDGVYQYDDFNKIPGGYELKNELPATAGLLGTNARQPGDAKYKDLNNDGIVDDADQTLIGTPYPKHTGGFNNNFTYKNFDLNVFFQWSYGNEVLNANNIFMEGLNGAILGRNVKATYVNRWTPENQATSIPRSGSSGISGVLSSRYIEDASFLRLKTISLGYNFRKNFIKGMESARVYVAAQNLYTWTSYSGPDPEVSTKGFGLSPGLDFSAYPIAQTIVFGINISL
ncbi:SusC/RagA family TonB-linked outer membrane protein [Chitinophaga sp. GCM10012297]|uniref:TonB-dependent receptor n=1 Tax=Chitinophaga chungangae TaxID=2821488 RepID=A0ABS3YKR6_9BACT|nr:TonB-dependent receptor [Chitinophaga chungangae]MBO9154704.1 TonB-dependent receptor [Chitinophaga chungangae]